MTAQQEERQTVALEIIASALSCLAARHGVHPEEVESLADDSLRFDETEADSVKSDTSVTVKGRGIRAI